MSSMLMGMKGAYLGHTYNSQLGKVQFHPSTGPTRPNQTHYMEGGTEAQWLPRQRLGFMFSPGSWTLQKVGSKGEPRISSQGS